MEKLHRWAIICFALWISLGCVNSSKPLAPQIEGHWYLSYGQNDEYYEEVIYYKNHSCSYSDYFGLVFRDYTLADSILEIYNDGVLEVKRTIEIKPDVMKQRPLGDVSVYSEESRELVLHKIKGNQSLQLEKLFAGDTAQANNFIRSYSIRKYSR